LLHLKTTTPNCIVYGELERYPVENDIKIYWGIMSLLIHVHVYRIFAGLVVWFGVILNKLFKVVPYRGWTVTKSDAP
jgi:hypothetical protein